MENVKKNIITRDSIAKSLSSSLKHEFYIDLFVTVLLSVIFAPLIALFVWLSVEHTTLIVIKILLCIITGGLFGLPIILNLIPLINVIIKKTKVKKGEFDITLRGLSYKREVYVRKGIEQRLVFRGFKEVCVGNTDYQLAASDDEYYLVHFRGKKYVELYYSLKMYELVQE